METRTTITAKANEYARRFRQILDHIDKHLDEDLNVEKLSQVAHLSKFHFHRQFSDYCGISVSRYVQLMRLKRASFRLVFNPLEPIIQIAMDAGFENPESFSRAFKHVFGQSPSQFRREPNWKYWDEQYSFSKRRGTDLMEEKEVKVVIFEPVMVAVLEHRGAPALTHESALRFVDWRKTTGLSPVASSRTYGVPYSDPELTSPEEFRFDICGSILEPVPKNEYGIVTKQIPGGECAVVRHLGSHERLGESVYYLYREWLPKSGRDLRDFPVYFHYLNSKFTTPEHELVTDVYLPLK
ncbi:MAG TPA: AraC family transcriptional regulator [Drouetiella sp.]